MRIQLYRNSIYLITIVLLLSLGWSYGFPREKIAGKYPQWITLDYTKLLPQEAMTRTGQPLSEARKDPSQQGAVQEQLDPYSRLLPEALDMISGSQLRFSLAEDFPVGSAQPGWAAILREGRTLLLTDHRNRVWIFLQGNAPRQAYQAQYPFLRHILNSLTWPSSSLEVTVYTYRHHYARSQLELNTDPYVFQAAGFPLPVHLKPLDLMSLHHFFQRDLSLEGVALDPVDGLILYGRRAPRLTLAGQPVGLSDLAVAYRAAFYAMDNPAFVSLDPHPDITKTRVNFGGLLQDTRIGSVVLDADKRFKTISSGLDPKTGEDLRPTIRHYLPGFFTVSERENVDPTSRDGASWIKTRFWFYPNSIQLISDPKSRQARIRSPQFQADAERSRDDFQSNRDYQKNRQKKLLPAIRKNIDQLNQNYDTYTQAFPIYQELNTVGRLMGICAWLERMHPGDIDLDALLDVELPPVSTERERTQLISTAYAAPDQHDPMQIAYLTPLLDQPVQKVFRRRQILSAYLERTQSKSGPDAIQRLWLANPPSRTLVHTRRDLEQFTQLLSELNAKPSALDTLRLQLQADQASLNRWADTLKAQQDLLNTLPPPSRNLLAASFNEQAVQFNQHAGELNAQVDSLNARFQRTPQRVMVEISGGINLEPQNFAIQKASVPRDRSYVAALSALPSSSHPVSASSSRTPAPHRSDPVLTTPRQERSAEPAVYRASEDKRQQGWSDTTQRAGSQVQRQYDGKARVLTIQQVQGSTSTRIKADWVKPDLIVFSPATVP